MCVQQGSPCRDPTGCFMQYLLAAFSVSEMGSAEICVGKKRNEWVRAKQGGAGRGETGQSGDQSDGVSRHCVNACVYACACACACARGYACGACACSCVCLCVFMCVCVREKGACACAFAFACGYASLCLCVEWGSGRTTLRRMTVSEGSLAHLRSPPRC